jgi:hypothetical protein
MICYFCMLIAFDVRMEGGRKCTDKVRI